MIIALSIYAPVLLILTKATQGNIYTILIM